MSNLKQDPQKWLAQQFECEFCADCGGDARHHTAVPVLGNWFARCGYPAGPNGGTHATIRTYRRRYDLRPDSQKESEQ